MSMLVDDRPRWRAAHVCSWCQESLGSTSSYGGLCSLGGVARLPTETEEDLVLRAHSQHCCTWFAVVDVAAHDGHVTSVHGPAWPSKGGWTYQEVCGAHGTVLLESTDRAACALALDAWLAECPGRDYCYTHNSTGGAL